MAQAKDELERRVARLVKQWIEHVWPQLEKRGGVPDTPMNRKERGRSNPAIVWRGLGIVDANLVASKYLRWAIDDTVEMYDDEGRSVIAEGGIPMADVLNEVHYNPGSIQTWRAEADAEAKRWHAAFKDTCRRLAKAALFRFATTQAGYDEMVRRLGLDYDDPQAFVVRFHPYDAQLEASEWQTAHNRDNNEIRTRDAQEAYERIYPKWRKFAEGWPPDTPKQTVKRAFKAFYQRTEKAEISVRKIERAIEYCEKGIFDASLKAG